MSVLYDVKYFVDREELLTQVLDKVRALRKGEPVRKRTTAFYGPRGSGKSWLIRELYQRIRDKFEDAVHLLYLSFCADDAAGDAVHLHVQPADADASPEPTCGAVLARCCEMVGFPLDPGLPLDELSARLVGWCQAHRGRPLLILVDGIDELPPDFLRLLESYLLAPLVVEPNVLLVLGGRTRDPRPGSGYVWKTPEIKLYADEHTLEPFDEGWTQKQLERLKDDYPVDPAAAPKVVEVGGGYPLSNVVLAQHVTGSPPDWRVQPEGLRECAEELLESVADLRQYFQALCVLRAFDEDRMAPLLATWFSDDPAKWDYQRCRRIREDMVATRLVRWRGGQGYVMDEAVRTVLENALREAESERWRVLHQAACDLYTCWVEQYPTARERWQPEAEYHQGRLQGEGGDGDV